jgi:hypothetical protein
LRVSTLAHHFHTKKSGLGSDLALALNLFQFLLSTVNLNFIR